VVIYVNLNKMLVRTVFTDHPLSGVFYCGKRPIVQKTHRFSGVARNVNWGLHCRKDQICWQQLQANYFSEN